MKGYIKVIITGVVIFSLGLIMFLVVLGLNDWTFSPKYEMKQFESSQNLTTLSIDYSAGVIETKFYDGDKIIVEYPESSRYTTKVTEDNGTLSIVSGKRHWYDVSFWIGKIPKAVVSIPNGLVLDVAAELHAGVITIGDGTFGDVTLKMNAGTVNFGDTVCGKFQLDLNAGAVYVGGATCNSLVTKVNAGTAEIKKLVCNDIKAVVNAGGLQIKIDGVKSEYTISVEKNAGSCNLSGQTSSTEGKKIDAKVNAGSLEVKFTN